MAAMIDREIDKPCPFRFLSSEHRIKNTLSRAGIEAGSGTSTGIRTPYPGFFPRHIE